MTQGVSAPAPGYQTSSPLKSLGQSKPIFKFCIEQPWGGGTKVYINGPGPEVL